MPKKTETKLNTDTGRAQNRPKRTPLHKRKVLEAPPRPGFVRRFVNEEFGRVQAFLEAGWTLVEGDSKDTSDVRLQDGTSVGSAVRRVVNKGTDANAKTAVLMEIPEDIYNEEQVNKQAEVDEIEASYDPSRQQQDGSDYGEMKKHYN